MSDIPEKYYYNSNPNLRKVGYELDLDDDHIDELKKCSEDYVYFIKNYCKIVSLDNDELVNFSLYDYQERFLNAVHNNRKTISLQSRQMGKCSEGNTLIKIKKLNHSDNTCQILSMTIEEFHNMIKNQS